MFCAYCIQQLWTIIHIHTYDQFLQKKIVQVYTLTNFFNLLSSVYILEFESRHWHQQNQQINVIFAFNDFIAVGWVSDRYSSCVN